jgi:hypothetical protein
MAKSFEDVVRKIKGLKARSHSPNAEEAATCAAIAAKLMQEYQISEAHLMASGVIKEEIPVRDGIIFKSGKFSTWKWEVARSCAKSFDCYPYISQGNFKCVGRPSDIQSTQYLFNMILLQIEDFAKKGWMKMKLQAYLEPDEMTDEKKNDWMKDFRRGCAITVAEKLKEQKGNIDTQRKLNSGDQMALIVLDRNKDAIARIVHMMNFGWKKVEGVRTVDGYSAGRAAGKNVRTNLSGRGSLTSGQRRLKS